MIGGDLTRQHVVENCQVGIRHVDRQPLAAMENLQEALSDLQLEMGCSQHVDISQHSSTHLRHDLEDGITVRDQAAPDCAVQTVHRNSISPQFVTTSQSHPYNCLPSPNISPVSHVSRTPNDVAAWSAPGNTDTPYFTPCDSSLQRPQSTSAPPSPSRVSKEEWYTPDSRRSSECDVEDTANSDEVVVSTPFGADQKVGYTIGRADSPSLLYGEGSAFNTELLEQASGLSGLWLT